jgi:acyl dehydratase
VSSEGDELPALRVTPDATVTERYAHASGDHNPIHLDDEFARSVGLPGRILHGLYTMALIARAQSEAFGGPEHLRRLSVAFRGAAVPGHEIAVTSTVAERDGALVRTAVTVTQQGRSIVRGASAELRI